MTTVILTIHVLIVLGLIGVVLLQRSDGGALGLGGGGGGGFMTGRGAANALTRTTSILAAIFFTTSITLAIFSDRGETEGEVLQELTGEEVRDPNAPLSADDLSRSLGADTPTTPEPTPDFEDALEAVEAAGAGETIVPDANTDTGAATSGAPAETAPEETSTDEDPN